MALDDVDKKRVMEIREQIAKLHTERSEIQKRCEPHSNAKETDTGTSFSRGTLDAVCPVKRYKCLDCGKKFEVTDLAKLRRVLSGPYR